MMNNFAPLPDVTAATKIRLFRKIRKTDSCWLWTGNRGSRGHATVEVRGRDRSVPRLVYLMLKGVDPGRHMLRPTCRNRLCVNPDHMRVTSAVKKSYYKKKPKRPPTNSTKPEVVARILELTDLPQTEVASLLGIAQSTVSRLRNLHGVKVDHRSTRWQRS
jgi:hypothetical protein